MAQQAFNLYKKQFGYPPKHEKHLQAFGKLNGIKLKYSECKDIIKNNKNVTSISKKPSNSTQKIHNNPKKTKINQKKKLRKNLFFAKKPGLIKKSRLNLVKPHNKKKNDNLPAIKPTKTPASALSQSTTLTQTTSASASASASAPIQTQPASLHFIYKGNVTINNKKFDKNGLIYYMGTKCNTSSYRNPVEMNLVKCSQSKRTCTQTKYLLQNYDKSNYISLRGYNEYNQHGWQLVKWIRIDLQNDIKLAINGYTLTNFTGIDWDFEASNDGKHWIVISKKRKYKGYLNKNDINCNYFMINNQNMYKHFRIKEFSAKSVIECGGIELYGDCFVDVNLKIDSTRKKTQFIKTSAIKKKYYADSFPTLKEYVTDLKSNKSAANQLTNQILSNKPSGDPSNKDTLLHILNGAANKSGKKCVFFDSSKNILPKSKYTKDSYLNMVDENNETSPQFVLTLKNLNGLIAATNKDRYPGVCDNGFGGKHDKSDKLLVLRECIQNNAYNPILDKIRTNLAKAHNVSKQRIVITDIYLNGVGCPYYVKDLTDAEKERIITETAGFEDKMIKLFDDYDKFSIHPALLEHTYDIGMFDALGNKTFGPSENGKYKVGPKGKEREYVQPTGWTRYGLKVLNEYDGGNQWLTPFQDAGNWYRAYHGTTRVAGSSIFKTEFKIGSNNSYGIGIYCSPDVNIAAGYCRDRGGTITLDTVNGKKEFYFVFQVAVNPATMNNPSLIQDFDPSCENCSYWIAPTGDDIRPYGILIKEV